MQCAWELETETASALCDCVLDEEKKEKKEHGAPRRDAKERMPG